MDAFDQFVFHDAIERCGLKARDASAKVDFHNLWIHHAIVRLSYAESDAEVRAAQQEIEQDIQNIQARHGWEGQMLSAFRERREALPTKSPEAGANRIPEPAVSPQAGAPPMHRPGWLAWLGLWFAQ